VAATIRRIAYCSVVVEDRPGEAFRYLSQMEEGGVNLLAFHAIPLGLDKTQLVMFPDHLDDLAAVAQREAWGLSAPQHAFLIQGDDHLGALVDWHRQLAEHSINVACSSGIADGRGGFAYVIYVRHEDVDRVGALLGA
jgi:hypothetical protein